MKRIIILLGLCCLLVLVGCGTTVIVEETIEPTYKEIKVDIEDTTIRFVCFDASWLKLNETYLFIMPEDSWDVKKQTKEYIITTKAIQNYEMFADWYYTEGFDWTQDVECSLKRPRHVNLYVQLNDINYTTQCELDRRLDFTHPHYRGEYVQGRIDDCIEEIW